MGGWERYLVLTLFLLFGLGAFVLGMWRLGRTRATKGDDPASTILAVILLGIAFGIGACWLLVLTQL